MNIRLAFMIAAALATEAQGSCCNLPTDTRNTCDGKNNCCPGYYLDSAAGDCVRCPPGYYCADWKGKIPCPNGTFNSLYQATSASWCLAQNQSCAIGKYIASAPNATKNITCAACKTNCSNKEYMHGSCGGLATADEVACLPCAACYPGYYHSPPCDGTRQDESECKVCTVGGCGDGFYRAACGGGLDGVCLPCPACPKGQYNKGCGGGSAGSCTNCSSCGVGWTQYRNCSALQDTGCKGGVCNTTTSCGALFCNYPVMNTPSCDWVWVKGGASINFLCVTSQTTGTCQECPPGWTASGAYCVECARGFSCDRAGAVMCEGACAAGRYPTCDDSTGRSTCSPCYLNQTLLDAGHRRLTRGGVLAAPELCAAYFECDVGYYLTSSANQTSVTCEKCAFPEPDQAGFEVFSHGLTFGDKYSCMHRPTSAPRPYANALGQYGSPARSCPFSFTSEPGRAPSLEYCLACPNAPAHGGFEQGRFDCAPRCAEEEGYERRGELCVFSDRKRVVCAGLDGYDRSSGGACTPSPLPWNEPGKRNAPEGGWTRTVSQHAEGVISALDMASWYRATAQALVAPGGGNPCSGVQSSVPNVGYVQDQPLFAYVCHEREMHTFYMVVKGGKFLYAFLERTFGNNNRFVMWQVRVEGDLPGTVDQAWRLPGKVCSAAWTSLDGYDHVHLAFCKAPFLAFVRAVDVRLNPADSNLTYAQRANASNKVVYPIGRRVQVLIGNDTAGRADGMRDVAQFGASLSVANTSDPRRLLVADRDNCRLVEVVIDFPGSFLTRATTIGAASCYSGLAPTPFPRMLTSVLGGLVAIFVTDLGLMQMDSVTRTVQLAIPASAFPVEEPLWISAGDAGSTVFMANARQLGTVRRAQVACPAGHESRRGGGCTPCGETAYVSQEVGRCAECSQPACALGVERLVPCSDSSDARCEFCATPIPPPLYQAYTFDANCSAIPLPPCPHGWYNTTSSSPCVRCPGAVWSALEVFSGVPPSGVCQCMAQLGAPDARLDANGVCRVSSPFGPEAGPYFSPPWSLGFNCTYEDDGCRVRGCYLQSAFPRSCAECALGLYGVNGMWCERCPGFRDPSPARDSCLCRAPSTVAEDGSGMCVCPAGHAEGWMTGCTPCLPGTFKPGPTAMSDNYLVEWEGCQACPAGTESDAGASACRPCPAGLYRESGSAFGLCVACGVVNHYAVDSQDGSSCVACQSGCAEGQRWTPCPVNPGMYACSPCGDGSPLPASRSWVKGWDNTNCMWECRSGYYEAGGECSACSERVCEPGFVFTTCGKYEDGHCRVGCVNETKPDENALWAEGCAWKCATGFAPREKVFAGWTEFTCERETLLPWSGWW